MGLSCIFILDLGWIRAWIASSKVTHHQPLFALSKIRGVKIFKFRKIFYKKTKYPPPQMFAARRQLIGCAERLVFNKQFSNFVCLSVCVSVCPHKSNYQHDLKKIKYVGAELRTSRRKGGSVANWTIPTYKDINVVFRTRSHIHSTLNFIATDD